MTSGPTLSRNLPPSSTRTRAWIGSGLLVVVTLLLCLVMGEVLFRMVFKYPLNSVELNPSWLEYSRYSSAAQRARLELAKGYVAGFPTPTGVEKVWFETDPPRYVADRPISPRVRRLFDKARAAGSGEALQGVQMPWNSAYVDQVICNPKGDGYMRRIYDTLFVYDAPEGQPYPHVSRFQSATVPSGLSTNNFGFRGPDITLNKPPDTIRIAFAGASTTEEAWGPHFAYPEFVGAWLNLWARKHGHDFTFEIINAGRTGFAPYPIMKTVQYEVLPLEPDIVVFYEGSNFFNPQTFIEVLPNPASKKVYPHSQDAAKRKLSSLFSEFPVARYSALARHAYLLFMGRLIDSSGEPAKPGQKFFLASGVNEDDPDPDRPHLPTNLSLFVQYFDGLLEEAKRYDTEVMIASFVWALDDGMKLDPVRNWALRWHLNDTLWPYKYKLLRRGIDFMNRVFRNYAVSRGIAFLDIDSLMPRDPAFFGDAIHTNYEGSRLRAWTMFLSLVPLLETRIASRNLPKADRIIDTRHPYIKEPRLRLNICAG